jgi:hypothetical protein
MRKFCLLALLFLLAGSTFGQTVRIPGPGGKNLSAAAPTFGQAKACFNFVSSPGTCTFTSAVTAGQTIFYYVDIPDVTSTITATDNCNTSGTSNTYTTDQGPTTLGTSRLQSGYTIIGANTATCTLSIAWTGSAASFNMAQATAVGSTAHDVSATLNTQVNAGTGANALTSNAATTSVPGLCFGFSTDANTGGGTLTAGTTIAWTLGAQTGNFPLGIEYFIQSVAGSITATFTTTNAFQTQQTGVSCFKP